MANFGSDNPPQMENSAVPAGENAEKQISGWTEREVLDYSAMTGDSGTREFGGSARVYEWKEEYGDLGPRIPEFEKELFGDPANHGDSGAGLDFSKVTEIPVEQEGPVKIDYINSFGDAGLHPAMLENVKLAGYESPTPIQKYTIPSILQGFDVIGVAQTGSGKTGAYLIPILSKLMGKAKKLAAPRPDPTTFREGVDEVRAEPLVLIVVPTRELAVQIFNEARKFSYRTMLRPCVVYGGMPAREQIHLLNRGCDILIGTPGRLVEFIHKPHIMSLRRLKYFVLDEADEMLQDDWREELDAILNGGEQDVGNIKFCLFSATFPKEARDLAKEHLSASHVRFRVGRIGSTTANIKQVVLQAERGEKRDVLLRLLQEMPGIRTIIFVNSRAEADNLDDFLYNVQLPVVSIHSDRTQVEREHAMRAFRSGNAPILVATGVTARGIDVRNVMHVINYDLPSMDHGGIEEYTHRIGRTGRIGHRGMATSLYSERDEPIASVLTRTLLETKQEVPDFLQLYVPEGKALENLKFEVESDFDPNDIAGAGDAGGDASGGGWGASAEGGNESGGAWGSADASANAPASNGWGASDNANPPANNSWGGGENNSSGWGSGNANAQPQAPAPAAAPAAAPAPAPAQDGGWNTTAPTNNSGWGSGNALGSASGWGSGNATGSASGWGATAAPTPQTSAW